MMALLDILNPRTASQVLANPDSLALYVDISPVFLAVKVALLALLLGYVFFALVAWVKVRRLEKGLLTLKRYHFATYLFVHLVLAAVGWLGAVILL